MYVVLLWELVLKADESLRTMRLMCIEVRYITFLCWQKPVHRSCGVVTHCIQCLAPTTSQRYLPSNNVEVVRRLPCIDNTFRTRA
jgi:hypothetical protein